MPLQFSLLHGALHESLNAPTGVFRHQRCIATGPGAKSSSLPPLKASFRIASSWLVSIVQHDHACPMLSEGGSLDLSYFRAALFGSLADDIV